MIPKTNYILFGTLLSTHRLFHPPFPFFLFPFIPYFSRFTLILSYRNKEKKKKVYANIKSKSRWLGDSEEKGEGRKITRGTFSLVDVETVEEVFG